MLRHILKCRKFKLSLFISYFRKFRNDLFNFINGFLVLNKPKVLVLLSSSTFYLICLFVGVQTFLQVALAFFLSSFVRSSMNVKNCSCPSFIPYPLHKQILSIIKLFRKDSPFLGSMILCTDLACLFGG